MLHCTEWKKINFALFPSFFFSTWLIFDTEDIHILALSNGDFRKKICSVELTLYGGSYKISCRQSQYPFPIYVEFCEYNPHIILLHT